MQMVKYKKREKIYLIQQQGIVGMNLRMKNPAIVVLVRIQNITLVDILRLEKKQVI